MSKFLVFLPSLLLVGCCTDPVIEYKEVPVPYPVKCTVKKPAEPRVVTREITEADTFKTMTEKALSEIEFRKAYEKELEGALDGCTK